MEEVKLCMKYYNCKFCPLNKKCEIKEFNKGRGKIGDNTNEHRQNNKEKNNAIK